MKERWDSIVIGNLAKFYRGLTYSGKDEVPFSNNVVLRSNNIDLETNTLNYDELKYISDNIVIPDEKRLKANSIFMCMSNGSKQHLGKVAFVDKNENYAFGGFMGLVVPSIDKIFPKYLFWYFCSPNFKRYIVSIGNGANINNIKFSDIAQKDIPVPPLSTQQSIVSELDKINELIALKKSQLKDLDNLAQSIFYEMFGDPVKNEKGWEVKKLMDVTNDIGDGLHGTPEYSPVYTGHYFINGNNLENGRIIIKEDTKMVSEETKNKYFILINANTILISINGTLGKCAYYDGEDIILGKSACYINLIQDINKKYVFGVLSSRFFKDYMEHNCTGTTIRNVSLKTMRTFPLPLPPLSLQHQFAERVEAIERMKQQVQTAIKDLETLLASRMQYWFD